MSSPVLELVDVTKDYGTAVLTRVLHGISLRIDPSEFVALVGPSGSGKSTLLNILGLLDHPTSGSVLIAGQDTVPLDDRGRTRLRGRTLGFVFQFHHLLGALSATENVMLPLAILSGKMERRHRKQAHAALDAVGLLRHKDSPARSLSGGEQQRVAIARALIHQPPLLLADEPTGNLDSKTSDTVFQLMRSIHERLGTAFLIVTHDLRLADRCDRVITLADGRIASDVVQ
jgi:lipoprotein-releasing system ATP-binding protein